MKALLFTLLLLLVAISPSLTAPPTPPPPPPNPDLTTTARYMGRQRIFYNVFTTVGVFNIELLYAPDQQRIIPGYFLNTRITQPIGGVTRVTIDERSVRRWTFNANQPGSVSNYISAELEFRLPYGLQQGGGINSGVRIIDRQSVILRHLTFTIGYVDNRYQRQGEPRVHPLEVTDVFMTVLDPSWMRLDQDTENRIRQRGMRRFLHDIGSASTQPPPEPPLLLSNGIWVHLLANRMSVYQEAGEIQCLPAPGDEGQPVPDPNCPSSSCRPPSPPGPRDPEDPGDSGAQRGTKRPWIPDLNVDFDFTGEDSGDSGGGGAHQGQQRTHKEVPIKDNPYLWFYPTTDIGGSWNIFGDWPPDWIAGPWLDTPQEFLVFLAMICYERSASGFRFAHDELRR
jgi:hypothetical protein